MRSLVIAAALSLIALRPAHASVAQAPLEERINIQAPVDRIYSIAVEEYRSAGFSVESAPPAMAALRIRKQPMESGYYLIEFHGRTPLWTEITARYENRRRWLFRRRTHEEPPDIAAYEAVLQKIKRRAEREPH